MFNDPHFHATNFIGQARTLDKSNALAACFFLCFLCVSGVQALQSACLCFGLWTQNPALLKLQEGLGGRFSTT